MLSQRFLTLLLLTLALSGVSSLLHAQKWEWVNPNPHNNKLFSIFFLNSDLGWAAGESGTIMQTTDGGMHWEVQNYGRDSIHSLFFIDENTGWAIGNSGTCLHTNNGGADWTPQNTNTSRNFSSIYFVNANEGWIAGQKGVLLHTINGGQSWLEQDVPTFSDLSAISFINNQEGWVSTRTGIILRTADGGVNWSSIANANVDRINDIQFIDKKNAWAVGKDNFKGIILRSINGGITWKKLFVVDNSPELYALHFYSNDKGWVSGELGLFLQTENTGLSWDQYFFEGNGRDIFALASGDIWITNGPGNIRTSHNQGADWFNNSKGFLDNLKTTYSKDNVNIWALVEDSNKIYISNNGGVSWEESASLLQKNNACSYYHPAQGVVVGENGGIARVENKLWIHVASPTNHQLNQVKFWNSQIVWSVGDKGTILKSSNGGQDWTSLTSPTSTDLLDIFILGKRELWIVGKNGTLLHSIDAGLNWTVVPLSDEGDILSVEFINNKYGWIAGEHSLIYTTQNGGQDWIAHYLPNNLHETITNIVFTSRTNGYCIVKNSNHIYHTIDGGENWSLEYGLVNVKSRPYTHLGKSEDKTLFIAGLEGTIGKLKKPDEGIVSTSAPIQKTMETISCYPSPSQGKLYVELALLSDVSKAELIIQDVLGRQVFRQAATSEQAIIDLSFCQDGLYFLNVISSTGLLVAQRKVVIKK